MSSWLCHEYQSPDQVVSRILNTCGAHLYLLYFSDRTQNWTMANANTQWQAMHAAYQELGVTMKPLCSSTNYVSFGGRPWSNLIDAQEAQDVFQGGDQMPYVIWCLTVGQALKSDYVGQHQGGADALQAGHLRRFKLSENRIEPVRRDENAHLEDGPKTTMRHSILAQAIALQWLYQNKRAEVNEALVELGIGLPGPLDYRAILLSGGVVVLEGVAGIGKTHSISAVQDFLKHRSRGQRDLKAVGGNGDEQTPLDTVDSLRAHLETVIGQNIRNPEEQERLFQPIDPVTVEVKTTIFVMHPSTSYEEMIGGLRPAAEERGGSGEAQAPDVGGRGPSLRFCWQKGRLLQAILEAVEDQKTVTENEKEPQRHLVVLDEINRCNLPSVLGELIYLIEPSRRLTKEKAKQADDLLEQRLAVRVGPEADGAVCYIPENLFILGTMNSSDRSILGFDQALRRRFPPYRLEPMKVEELKRALKVADEGEAWGKAVKAWGALNAILRCVIGPDAMIGHSYWFNAKDDGGDPATAWRFGVLPQAIHAAEAARREAFLADVWAVDKEVFVQKYAGARNGGEDRWRFAMTACGIGPVDPARALDSVKSLLEAVRSMDCKVRLTGDGHGEKLMIEQQ